MRTNFEKHYIMFVDESGRGNLNYEGRYFILSTVVIESRDFEIIQGYLRLLKRKFLKDEMRTIHTSALFERPYTKYRRLVKPRNRLNAFVNELHDILATVPFRVGFYLVDMETERTKLKYIPKGKKIPKEIQLDLPYKLCALEAIRDFTKFLKDIRATGEIVIESRLGEDSSFVTYFDLARKHYLPGGVLNPTAGDVKDKINSLTIANKRLVNGGLEIADICSHSCYRHVLGDPGKEMKVSMRLVNSLFSAIKKKVYIMDGAGRKIKTISLV